MQKHRRNILVAVGFTVLLLAISFVWDPHSFIAALSAAPFLLLGVNAQVGRQIRVQSPPHFANCTVRGGTWEESDATRSDQNENADEETFNVTASNRGEDVKCDIYPDAGYEPAVADVLTEIDVDNPRSWVIVAPVVRKRFGKRGLIYSLNLIRRDALDTSITS